ncbi:MAG TPA: phage holin family protein [Rubricoccaceae bacterium]|jgi:hypothetical protein
MPSTDPYPPSAPDPRTDDRSIGDLFGELFRETSTLVRQEIALAKVEITTDAKAAGKDAGAAIAGGAVAYAGLIVLLAGLGWGLGELLGDDREWLGLTLVGLAVVIAGFLMLRGGLAALKKIDPTPERTIQTLKEDKEWLKNQTA